MVTEGRGKGKHRLQDGHKTVARPPSLVTGQAAQHVIGILLLGCWVLIGFSIRRSTSVADEIGDADGGGIGDLKPSQTTRWRAEVGAS